MGRLDIEIGNLKLKNPVMVASGTFGKEFSDFFDLSKLGAIITKTVTLKGKEGNLPPRICETPAGMLNSIGLENPGVEQFLKEQLPDFAKIKTNLIVSIAGETIDEFVELTKILSQEKNISALELNISCPNVDKGGMLFGSSAEQTNKLIKKVVSVSEKPIIAKLTPNVGNITEIALAAEKAGCDSISLINTILGLAIDIETQKSKIGKGFGGLSGPAIKPIALRMVYQVAKRVKIPVIGTGGISNYQDALEFFLAGASAIQVGTANFVNPSVSIEIIDGLDNYLAENYISSIEELIGKVKI